MKKLISNPETVVAEALEGVAAALPAELARWSRARSARSACTDLPGQVVERARKALPEKLRAGVCRGPEWWHEGD
jgi:hypothetical protein